MIDFRELYEHLQLEPGESLTIEINGMRAEMTATELVLKERITKNNALQTALTAAQVTKEIRGHLIYPNPDAEEVKKLAEDLVHAGEYLKKWAAQ